MMRPRAGLDHRRQHLLRAEHRTRQVHRQHPIPERHLHLHELRSVGLAGVVDEDVRVAERRPRLLEGGC